MQVGIQAAFSQVDISVKEYEALGEKRANQAQVPHGEVDKHQARLVSVHLVEGRRVQGHAADGGYKVRCECLVSDEKI